MSSFGYENNSLKSWIESTPLPPSKLRLNQSLHCQEMLLDGEEPTAGSGEADLDLDITKSQEEDFDSDTSTRRYVTYFMSRCVLSLTL